MPVPIDDLQDVRRLVRQLGIKVGTVEDLHQVLAALSTSYNPDAIRVKAIRNICTTAISLSMGAAGLVSFFALVTMSETRLLSEWFWPLMTVLIVMWGVAGAISLTALLIGLLWLRQAPTRPTTEPGPMPTERSAAPPGPANIMTPDNLKFPREFP